MIKNNKEVQKMILTLSQTKLVGLTMKLDLEARNYKLLCEKLDKYKAEKIDESDENKENIQKVFWEYLTFRYWTTGIFIIALAFLINPIIGWWVGPQYILKNHIGMQLCIFHFVEY